VGRRISWKEKITRLADEVTEDCARDTGDPLDGDETEYLARLFWTELDLRQGNITEEEYRERLALLEKGRCGDGKSEVGDISEGWVDTGYMLKREDGSSHSGLRHGGV